MDTLLTMHPVTQEIIVAACRVCHQITRDGVGHLKAAHPRRYALAQERKEP